MKQFFKSLVVTLITLEARAVLRKYKPHIVAITGSVGKTSTKDAIYSVLSRRSHVRGSEKSFNSEVGLPLTILGVPNAWNNPLRWLQNVVDGLLLLVFPTRYPEWLVLEVGADRPGDIRSLVGWLKTDVVVITHLPDVPVHVEFFDSPEALMEEKAALIDTLKPGGALILNIDDPHTKELIHREPAADARIVTFGFAEEADVRGEGFVLMRENKKGPPLGMSGYIRIADKSAPVEVVGSIGTHAFLPGVAAAAVGHALGMDLPDILEGLESYNPPAGRMRLITGLKGSLIIDDTYNASPAASAAGLETLAIIKPKGRTIVAMADMMELGRHSVDEHRKIGAHVAKTADLLITVGFRARDIAQGALDNGMKDESILQFEDARKAGQELQNMLAAGDVVLVKGSQSMRMEKLVEEIMQEPSQAPRLLVRQDEEWKKR
jgi:UDP-N-acetylmuramoyl-tripeptide--D-alanyl-D-alanine ligase